MYAETELHVSSLPPHHELLLNKFNVVDHHLLVHHPRPHPQSRFKQQKRCVRLKMVQGCEIVLEQVEANARRN
jgi:ATP adenylyltransferase/5',5'''-P-1,P-4-tetraphosphate phosphorylase II